MGTLAGCEAERAQVLRQAWGSCCRNTHVSDGGSLGEASAKRSGKGGRCPLRAVRPSAGGHHPDGERLSSPGPSEARAPLFLGCMIIWHHGIYEKLIEE